MKKLLFGTIFLAFMSFFPVMTIAAVDISIGVSLPPPIVFGGPPDVIVMPDTQGAYVVPDIEADMFFWNGWWWRLWEGRWYRSQYYNRGWGYYNNVPTFYFDVDPGWRGYYRDRNWYGHRWNYERISHHRLQQNWKSWQNDRHWERRGTWGVQSYQPRPTRERQELRHQRQQQYQQRPEIQQHEKQRQQQQRQSQQRESQEQHFQPQGQKHQGESQHPQSQGRSQGRDGERRGDEEHRR